MDPSQLTRVDIMTSTRPDGSPHTNRKAAETACVADGDGLKCLEYLLSALMQNCKCDSGVESAATSATQPQAP